MLPLPSNVTSTQRIHRQASSLIRSASSLQQVWGPGAIDVNPLPTKAAAPPRFACPVSLSQFSQDHRSCPVPLFSRSNHDSTLPPGPIVIASWSDSPHACHLTIHSLFHQHMPSLHSQTHLTSGPPPGSLTISSWIILTSIHIFRNGNLGHLCIVEESSEIHILTSPYGGEEKEEDECSDKQTIDLEKYEPVIELIVPVQNDIQRSMDIDMVIGDFLSSIEEEKKVLQHLINPKEDTPGHFKFKFLGRKNTLGFSIPRKGHF